MILYMNRKALKNIMKSNYPKLCEIVTSENQPSLFKQGYKANNDGTFSPLPLSEMQP